MLYSKFHLGATNGAWKLAQKKTVLLSVTKKRNPSLFSYTINNISIEKVSKFKYLGVVINSRLNWNDHVQHVTSSIRKLGLLRHKLREAPSHVKLLAYNSIIRPKLEYAAVVGTHTRTKILTNWRRCKGGPFALFTINSKELILHQLLWHSTISSRYT